MQVPWNPGNALNPFSLRANDKLNPTKRHIIRISCSSLLKTSSITVRGKLQMMMLFAGSDTTPRGGCEGHSRHGQTLARPQRECEAEGQRRGQHPTDDRSRLREALHGAVMTSHLLSKMKICEVYIQICLYRWKHSLRRTWSPWTSPLQTAERPSTWRPRRATWRPSNCSSSVKQTQIAEGCIILSYWHKLLREIIRNPRLKVQITWFFGNVTQISSGRAIHIWHPKNIVFFGPRKDFPAFLTPSLPLVPISSNQSALSYPFFLAF